MIIKIQNEIYREIGFYIICFIMIFLPLTMLLISLLLGFNAEKEFNSYLRKPVVDFVKGDREYFWIFGLLSLICIAAVGYTLLKIDEIPILALFRGSDELGQLRIEASHGFEGNVLIRNIFATGLTPILSLIAYVYSVMKKTPKWKLLFLVLFGCSIIINIYDLQKAPIFFYILMFLVVRIYIGKMKLTYFKVITLGGLGAVLLVMMYVFIAGLTDISSYLIYYGGPIGRLILSQLAPFYLHLDYFGEVAPFLNGQSLPNSILGMYGLEQIRSAEIVMQANFPERVTEGIAGVLNTLYAGEAYANFGYAGVILGTLYLGAFIQIFYIAFLRLPKHPVFVVLLVYFTINIPRVVVGGFIDFIYNPFWVIVLVFLIGSLAMVRFKDDTLDYFRRARKSIRN